MTVGKTPLNSGRRKQYRIVAQFPVESRSEGEGGNLQILQGSPVICTRKKSHADFVNPFPRPMREPRALQIVARLAAGKSSDGCR